MQSNFLCGQKAFEQLNVSQNVQANMSRYLEWFTEKALPLWSKKGVSSDFGAAYEQISLSGEADLTSSIRVRVQARQAYAFAACYEKGWLENGKRIAENIFSFTEKNAHRGNAEAGYCHLINGKFEIIDTKWDLYDHAFFFLMFAKLFSVTADKKYLAKAEALLNYINANFLSNFGGWKEGNYVYNARRQNPHMHLFEAFLSLYKATGDLLWLVHLKHILTLFESSFYDHDKALLLEFFDDEWNPTVNGRGHIVEPGHMFEWIWLLDKYQTITSESMEQYFNPIYANAIKFGESASGLIYSEVSSNGQIINPTKRCWAMTEYIKASIVQTQRKIPGAAERICSGLDNLTKYFLSSEVDGLYSDSRDLSDANVGSVAPASTLYHLTTLALEIDDYLNL